VQAEINRARLTGTEQDVFGQREAINAKRFQLSEGIGDIPPQFFESAKRLHAVRHERNLDSVFRIKVEALRVHRQAMATR